MKSHTANRRTGVEARYDGIQIGSRGLCRELYRELQRHYDANREPYQSMKLHFALNWLLITEFNVAALIAGVGAHIGAECSWLNGPAVDGLTVILQVIERDGELGHLGLARSKVEFDEVLEFLAWTVDPTLQVADVELDDFLA